MPLDPFKKGDVVDILDGTPVNKFGIEDGTVCVQLEDDVVIVKQESLKAFP